jgi:hypothetical protein
MNPKFKLMIKKVIVFSFLILISCKENNCTEIDPKFTSYAAAIKIVKESSFNVEEKVNTDSSWIDSIEFYSCDEISGYLIVNTNNGRSYIHKNVPVQVWNEFKNTESFGRFYNQNIKG